MRCLPTATNSIVQLERRKNVSSTIFLTYQVFLVVGSGHKSKKNKVTAQEIGMPTNFR